MKGYTSEKIRNVALLGHGGCGIPCLHWEHVEQKIQSAGMPVLPSIPLWQKQFADCEPLPALKL